MNYNALSSCIDRCCKLATHKKRMLWRCSFFKKMNLGQNWIILHPIDTQASIRYILSWNEKINIHNIIYMYIGPSGKLLLMHFVEWCETETSRFINAAQKHQHYQIPSIKQSGTWWWWCGDHFAEFGLGNRLVSTLVAKYCIPPKKDEFKIY